MWVNHTQSWRIISCSEKHCWSSKTRTWAIHKHSSFTFTTSCLKAFIVTSLRICNTIVTNAIDKILVSKNWECKKYTTSFPPQMKFKNQYMRKMSSIRISITLKSSNVGYLQTSCKDYIRDYRILVRPTWQSSQSCTKKNLCLVQSLSRYTHN